MAKILVEILGEYGIIKRKKYAINENRVLIEKAKGRTGVAWTPGFNKNCLLPYTTGWGPFKKLHTKLMVLNGAENCIEFFGNNGVDIPTIDRDRIKKLFQAHVIKSAGATTQKVEIPTAVYILIGFTFILSLVSAALTYFISGRLGIV